MTRFLYLLAAVFSLAYGAWGVHGFFGDSSLVEKGGFSIVMISSVSLLSFIWKKYTEAKKAE